MTSLYTEIEIEAPKQQVWEVLIRKEQWRYWNSFLFDREPSWPLVPGREVKLSLRRLPKEEPTEFQPLVKLVQPEVCLIWVAETIGFRNQHVFELQELDLNRTRYIHKDSFSGILSRVFLPFIRADEKQGMERMARELKIYVESYSQTD